jgi:hypothetical protein
LERASSAMNSSGTLRLGPLDRCTAAGSVSSSLSCCTAAASVSSSFDRCTAAASVSSLFGCCAAGGSVSSSLADRAAAGSPSCSLEPISWHDGSASLLGLGEETAPAGRTPASIAVVIWLKARGAAAAATGVGLAATAEAVGAEAAPNAVDRLLGRRVGSAAHDVDEIMLSSHAACARRGVEVSQLEVAIPTSGEHATRTSSSPMGERVSTSPGERALGLVWRTGWMVLEVECGLVGAGPSLAPRRCLLLDARRRR